MRAIAWFTATLIVAVMPCASAAAQRADSILVGSWSGQGSITVPWTAQRTLAVRLSIKEDGSVTGSVGDAQLLDAWVSAGGPVARAVHPARRRVIDGNLRGLLIRAEGIQRDRVHLFLECTGATLVGELQTSGSYGDAPEDLVLTVKGLVLQRVDRAVSTLPTSQLTSPR